MSLSPIFGYASFVSQPQDFAFQGWGRVTWGMTRSRVQAIYPEAQPARFGSLKILGTDLSANYDINFAFDTDQRLKSVTLAFHGVPSDEDFIKLQRWLMDKYGEPKATGAWRYAWTRGQTDITLARGHNLTISHSRTAPTPA